MYWVNLIFELNTLVNSNLKIQRALRERERGRAEGDLRLWREREKENEALGFRFLLNLDKTGWIKS